MALSKILEELKFTRNDFEGERILKYNSNLGPINFVELAGTDKEDINKNFYKAHREIWNENVSEVFITTINDEEVLICDSKTKPNDLDPIETTKIYSFKYSENTVKARHYLELLKKDSIDNGRFWEEIYGFIRQRIKDKKRKPIDVDLLKNLTDTKEKILNYLERFDNKDEIAQKLIDRCLFIRFLEDRIKRDGLKCLLKRRDVNGLLSLFDKYNDCLNGDLFEKGDIPSDIEDSILDKLNNIFGETYTYTSKQQALCPYQFDKIPILLISHIYEQFLNPIRRRSEGIVFTPENVTDYIIEKSFDSKSYLFSWDDVPGNNTELIKFLKDDLKIEWAENAEIKKSDNDRIITLVNKNKKNSITLNLNKKENNVTLEIADGKTYKYLLKEENSKLNIYSEYIKNKSKEGNITVLDPSCGSGIFLVKFFERLVKERESELGEGKSLDIYKKSDLLKKSIHGIDTDPNALRIAAFSLYLKIFDRVNPEILKKVLEKCEEKKEHFMFPGLKEHNLIQGNSLFDEDIFKGKKFDLILGNPPWDYDFSENERRLIDRKWPDVSDYQSSQCFLFKIDDWMNENSIVGMVVNLSNFTNQNAECFRKLLLEKYSIKKFLNLINIKKITFKDGSESACVLIFNKDHDIEENDIKFIVPDMTHFSELTREIVVKDDDIAKVRQSGLSEETWHLSILGLNKYLKLIERIESDVYLFSLTPEYKQYLQCSDVDDELKNEFKESKCFLSNEAKLSRIDEKKWNIVDFNREYKIKDVGVQLNIYEKRIALERYSETFEQGATFYSMEKHGYLFGWDDIPENNGDLLKFLKENILVDWIKNPEIKKSNDENAVTITELENSIILKRKLTEKKVIITYNRETSNFILKMVKGTFNVYNPDYNNIAKKKYEGIKKEDNNYFPKIQSLGGLKPYLCPQLEGYIKYGPHLEKARKFNIFLDNKLVINRGWPIKSFSVSDTIIFSSSFYIFKPDKKFPSDYIHLFKAILNSKLAYFYLRSKYLQRLKGNHTKVNLVDLKKFPIPYLKDEKIIKEIINFVSKIKEENDIEKYQSQIDELVFDLYELDYYERQQIKDYYKIYKQKRQNNNLVSTDDMNEYINEFIDSFNLFIEKGYFLNAKFYICNFLGSLVKFEFSKEKKETEPEYSKLKRLISIILHEKISDIKNVLKEEEMRIYDNNVLYLYKSNHIKDWTRTKALDDVKREFGLIYKNLPD